MNWGLKNNAHMMLEHLYGLFYVSLLQYLPVIGSFPLR
jgi:hypothetical protein